MELQLFNKHENISTLSKHKYVIESSKLDFHFSNTSKKYVCELKSMWVLDKYLTNCYLEQIAIHPMKSQIINLMLRNWA